MILKVKVGDRIFEVEVGDTRARPIRAVVDEVVFEVWPESKAAYTVASSIPERIAPPRERASAETSPTPPQPAAPRAAAATISGKSVRAPIPGVITAILVRPGDDVAVGQELCKLEAMKMNNSIRANRAGKIDSIIVSVGQQVKHNDLLMEYTE
ncbi:MAG: hypothetical protein MUC85_01040 [Anaerolineales bacterium]|jgi:biotin carboxyl carrier protein|nr:hypothetical protein [Anaerolineales bacterium]